MEKGLGRIEELRKGVDLKRGAKDKLNKKYDLVEKNCLSNKIQPGIVERKHFTEKTF